MSERVCMLIGPVVSYGFVELTYTWCDDLVDAGSHTIERPLVTCEECLDALEVAAAAVAGDS